MVVRLNNDAMKKVLYLVLIITNNLFSQNLVINPSFEDFECIQGRTGANFTETGGWSAGNMSSPDFYNPNCKIQPSTSGIRFQKARHGNNYAGIIVFDMEGRRYREYLQGTLKNKLIVGKSYYICFNVSLKDPCSRPISDLNLIFSTSKIDKKRTRGKIRSKSIYELAKVENIIYQDTTNWMQISGEYVANGGESNFTIGNFKDAFRTHYEKLDHHMQRQDVTTFYFVDDISVIEIPKEYQLNRNDSTLFTRDFYLSNSPLLNEVLDLNVLTFAPKSSTLVFDKNQVKYMVNYLLVNPFLNFEIKLDCYYQAEKFTQLKLIQARTESIKLFLVSNGISSNRVYFESTLNECMSCSDSTQISLKFTENIYYF